MNGQVIIPIQHNILIISLIIRVVAVVVMALFVLPKMIKEYRLSSNYGTTKRFLLGLGITFFLGSLIPLWQTSCYLLGCYNVNQTLPVSVVVAILNLLGVVLLAVLYNTKEAPPSNAVKDIKDSLKVIGQQTKRAEKRSEEIDENTAIGVGKPMRGVTPKLRRKD